jgi:anti-sigma B factor antagonist
MGFEPQFSTSTETRNGVARIALSGKLDVANVPVLKEPLTRFEDDGVSAIMLDLRDLTFIDSAGLHAFLQARGRARANGHRLIFIRAGANTRRVFELTGTQFLIDDQEAVNVLDQFTGSNVEAVG